MSNISLATEIYSTKLLFLAGSARKNSLNKMLAFNAFQIAEDKNVKATFIDLKDYPLPIYDGDLEANNGIPDNAIKLKEIFKSHDGIFIASPEYNSSISPLLKNTLDWVSRETKDINAVYRNKIVAIGSASPGGFGGMRSTISLQIILSDIGMIILPKKIHISKAYAKFNNEGLLVDDQNYKRLTEVVNDLIQITGALKSTAP